MPPIESTSFPDPTWQVSMCRQAVDKQELTEATEIDFHACLRSLCFLLFRIIFDRVATALLDRPTFQIQLRYSIKHVDLSRENDVGIVSDSNQVDSTSTVTEKIGQLFSRGDFVLAGSPVMHRDHGRIGQLGRFRSRRLTKLQNSLR